MAISKDSLTVEVVLDSSGAVKGIKDLQGKFTEFDKVVSSASQSTNKANQANNQLASTFSGVASVLSKAALPMLAVQSAATAINQAFGFLSSTLGDFVNDYAEAEKAQVLLTRAIENSNGRIKNSADAWGAYLDQLQETKNVSGDFLRTLVTQGIQLGFSETQIKSLISASIGLSKVTGEDVGTAFEKLINSTRGISRGLAVLVPEVASLTQEQLKSGDAFEIVANKFSHVASGAGTYSEAVKAAKLASGELSEDIGKLIIESLNLTGAIESITGFINKLRSAIENVNLDVLITKFIEIAKVLAIVVPIVSAITVSVAALEGAISLAIPAIVLVTAKIVLIGVAVTAAVAALELIIRNVKLFGEALMVLSRGGRGLDELKKKIDLGFSGEIIKQGINFVNGFTDATKKATSSLGELGQESSRTKIIDPQDVEKAKNIVQDVLSFTKELRVESESKNKGELGSIDLQLQKNIEMIAKKREQLIVIGQLTQKNKEILAIAEKAALQSAQSARNALAEKAFFEDQKKAKDALIASGEKINASYDAAKQSQLGTFDIIDDQLRIENEKLEAIENQLGMAGNLNAENKAALIEQKNTLQEIANIQKSGAWMAGVSSAISAAGSGAESLVSNVIDQVGAAFGPEGKMIAGAINLLSKGGEFVGKLFDGVVDVVTKLPEKLVSAVTTLIDKIIAFLSNTENVTKIIKGFVKGAAQIISAMIKALPAFMKIMASPKFWIEIAIAFVEAIGDALGGILGGGFANSITNGVEQGIANATQAITGFTDQMFGIVADVSGVGGEKSSPAKAIEQAFKTGSGWFKQGMEWIGKQLNSIFGADSAFGKIITGAVSGLTAILGVITEVIRGVLDPIAKVFMKFIDFLLGGGLFNAVKDFFTTLKDSFLGLADEIGKIFKTVISSVYNTIADFINSIKIPAVTLINEKILGKQIKIGWDAIDLIPGEISHMAYGGIVGGNALASGDSFRNDIIPTMLSPGEAVIPRSLMGQPMIGNAIGNLLSTGALPSSQGSGDMNFNIVLNVDTSATIDENFIRQRLVPTVREEFKKASLRGDFVLSAKGVRS